MDSDLARVGGGRQATPLARIESSEEQGVRVVAVTGELDISNVRALEDATFDLPNERLGVVLDLSATSYLDSATLGLLFRLSGDLRRRGQGLGVVCAQGSSARRVLDMTGFQDAHDGREGAIERLREDCRCAAEGPDRVQ
jgi:anti-anti-sigma factor